MDLIFAVKQVFDALNGFWIFAGFFTTGSILIGLVVVELAGMIGALLCLTTDYFVWFEVTNTLITYYSEESGP